MTKRCDQCEAYFKQNVTQGECRFFPPQSHFIGMQQSAVQRPGGASATPITYSAFTTVQADAWCMHFKRLLNA